jgi:hypothetical protein
MVKPGVPPNAGLFIAGWVQQETKAMARIEARSSKRKTNVAALPFTRSNYQILAVGLVVIVLGFITLGQQPWDGTLPLVVAPILLVLGYCVIIPLGILYRSKAEEQANGATSSPQQ